MAPIARPMAAVEILAPSGAVVLNVQTTTSVVTRATIQPKNRNGRGVLTISSCTSPVSRHSSGRGITEVSRSQPSQVSAESRAEVMAGTHTARHTTWPSASSTRTECRDAIPEVDPDQAPRYRLPILLLHQHPLCIVGLISSGGGTAGSNPSATIPGRQSPATAPTHALQPDQAPIRAGPLPSCGSSVASSGNQIREARSQHRPQPRRRHLPDQP